jgi:hypothetical protein
MKTDRAKTTATTEEVSLNPGGKGIGAKKGIETVVCQKIIKRSGKVTCKPEEQEENQEKHPRWSWATNQMGNPE